MSEKILIIGSGGHSKVVIDTLFDLDINVDGIFTKEPLPNALWNLPTYLEESHSLIELYKFGFRSFFVAIGDNVKRVSIFREAISIGMKPLSVVSPDAKVSKKATIGTGVLIVANSIINADSQIGNFSIVNTSAVVEHDNTIGIGTHVAPNATLCGGVTIGDFSLVGAGVTVIPNITIGSNVTIGAGSVVIKNVESGTTVLGAPAVERGVK